MQFLQGGKEEPLKTKVPCTPAICYPHKSVIHFFASEEIIINLTRYESMRQALAVFGLGVALAMAALPPVAAKAASDLIIPGQSIGQTHLGSNGNFYLNKLPKPDAVDVGMSQFRGVWVSKNKSRTDTLFIHTVSNGALNVQPLSGSSIDVIRVTSPWYHTHEGISTASTRVQIFRRFPNAHPVDGNPTIYDDAKLGIAFEFAKQANASSPCIAIMVHPPDNVHLANTENVNNILHEKN
ncbi:MAG: hypothetical protein KME46_01205 [Brasilonema angustatum HA4187-MV1]|nr:hypothetical protein [Brasilonema angustatum HA4187-MV1]